MGCKAFNVISAAARVPRLAFYTAGHPGGLRLYSRVVALALSACNTSTGSEITARHHRASIPTSMNKLFSFTAAGLVALVSNSFCATLSVLPGTSIQAKIDQAQPGDIVAIFGGTYNEDININKAIRLVEVSGQQVNITGNITFSGIANAPIFEGFQVGSSGRGITVSNTTGLILRNIVAADFVNVGGDSEVEIITSQIASGSTTSGNSTIRIRASQVNSIAVNGQSAELIETTTGGISQSAGTLNVFKCTISGNIDTGLGSLKTIVFRSTFSGDAILRSKKVWFGYNDARSFNFRDQSEARVVVVGCKIDRQNGEAHGVQLSGTNNFFLLANTEVIRVSYQAYYRFGSSYYGWENGPDENAIDVRGVGNKGLICNNYCQMTYLGNDNGVRGDGIFVRDSANFRILSNLIVGAKHGVSAPFGTVAKNNLYWASPWNAREAEGVIAEGTLYTDPKFVTSRAPTLEAESPCNNAGVEDPIYANRDGTRNTIGPSGGTLYDPDARTTENPVVISFDLGPEQVLEGEATEILLSNGQAVSQP